MSDKECAVRHIINIFLRNRPGGRREKAGASVRAKLDDSRYEYGIVMCQIWTSRDGKNVI